MPNRTDIEFLTTDGLKLRGWLYSGGEKRSTIILSNGFSGSKNAFCDDFAERFQAAGYTALLYDNRNWFDSEGLPRNESDPLLQTRDYITAFNFAATLPDVDPANIVFWGSSLAGGNAICAAAVEKRVRGVICQVPFVSGEFISAQLGAKAQFILADRTEVCKGGSSQMIPIVPDSMEELISGTSKAILGTPDVFPFLAELDRRGVKWEKYATTQSSFYLQFHEPQAFIHRISPTPLLMVVGDNDLCIPTNTQLAMYAKALEPKRLHVVRGAGHFDVYYGKAFEENIGVQLDFLKTIF